MVETPNNQNGSVVGGTVITVPYVYSVKTIVETNGSVIATHKDTEGNELAPQETIKDNRPDGEDYSTTSKEIPFKTEITTTPQGFERTVTTHYELVDTPSNKDGKVAGGKTTIVPYIYKPVKLEVTNGSVIATYSDEDGNTLADIEFVKTNVSPNQPYSTVAKTIEGSIVQSEENGLTKVTTTHYELIQTPENAKGIVVGNKTIIVPYVYRKVVTEVTNGSVVSTYQDTEGNELAPTEKIVTNVPNGESYFTNAKSFPSETIREEQPDGSVKVIVTEYKLVSTPKNKDGQVKGGSVITVPYVYEKVVTTTIEPKVVEESKFEIPKDAPKLEKDEYKLTRFMLEDRQTEIKSYVEGFVEPLKTIGNYVYTGVTDSDEGGAVITHIYKLVEPEVPTISELPKDSPVHDKPEYKGGVVPNDAPVHNRPEFNGGVIPNDAPTYDKPEFNGGVVPIDAPTVSNPELKVTRFVLEDRVTEVQGSVTGLVDAPTLIGKYVFTGKTEVDASGSVRIHIYKLVEGSIPNDAPILEKPELKISEKEVPTPEVPTPETPVAEVEKPSQPVAQKPQEKFATKELPNTGTEVSQSSALGILGLVSSLGLLSFVNKRKETEDKD